MILPAFRIVSEIIRPGAQAAVGYQAMVYAIASIAFPSFIVWATTCSCRHAARWRTVLHVLDDADRDPTGVKVFNWVSTMWKVR
jgi:cytochrome c oxidase subunit 1